MAGGGNINVLAGDGVVDTSGDWTAKRVLVVTLCFLLNMLDGTDLLIMSFIAPVLSQDWSVSPQRLGVLFSASLAGMAIGCLAVAPWADRFGRRVLILMALTVTASAMTLSALTHDVFELMVARLFVGIGVGTIGVTMTTLAAEFSPARYANFAVGFVQAGWPFGSIITAFVAANWLPGHSWQSMLVGIGVLSVGLLVLMWLLLPESLSFLALKRGASRGPALTLSPLAAVAALFKEGRALPSVLLWSAVTLGYFDLYFVISWIPKLVTQAGLPLSQAIYAGATYNLGAFMGTAAVGWIAVRFPLHRVIATYLGLAAITLLVFGGFNMPVWLTLLVALCIGVTVQGGFNGFWALSARLYPADMRNTGVGWALGVGRVGAVLGPIVGGLLVGAHVSLPAIFAVFAISVAVAAALTLRIGAP